MREILGNKKGIRDSVLNELIALYDVQVPLGQLISAELALKLADIFDVFLGLNQSFKPLFLIFWHE